MCLVGILFAVAVGGLLQGRRGAIDGYGLLSALPLTYLSALAGLLITFAVSVRSADVAPRWLYVQVVVLSVTLALAPVLLEPHARFATAYTHVGLVDYIQRHGEVLTGYDARFSWPGFFAAAALFADAAGVTPRDLVRWAPLLLGLGYLLAFSALVSRFIPDPRRRAIAMAMLVLFNWVGQDYFAPQGLNFLLHLVFIALLATLYPLARPRSGPVDLLQRLPWWRQVSPRDRELPEPAHPPAVRGGLLAALVAVFAASTVSHQLTPVFMLLSVGVLTLLRVIRSWTLVVLLSAVFLAWFVWGADDYWAGHLGELVGGVGELTSSLERNVGSRVEGTSSEARATVVRTRIAMSVGLALLAAIGLLRARSRALLVPGVLALTPVVVLALQSYGGEAVLRIQLLSLPFQVVLAAYAVSLPPRHGSRSASRLLGTAATAAAACTVSIAFFLARYGNESFEEMRPGDVSTVDALYAAAPRGASLYSLTDSMPWKDRSVGEHRYVILGERSVLGGTPLDVEEVNGLLERAASSDHRAFVVVTESQWNHVEQVFGGPEVTSSIKQTFTASPFLRPVYGDIDSGVFELVPAP